MEIINQLLQSNGLWFISLAEIVVYTILTSLILYHFIIYWGRRKYTEGKYYLYFSYYFSGLLLYLFTDSNAYLLLVFEPIGTAALTTCLTAVAFLIIYRSIIAILNMSLPFEQRTKNMIDRIYRYFALVNLVWLIFFFYPQYQHFELFWILNTIFIISLSFIYFPVLVKNNKGIQTSVRIIAWLSLSYVIYIVLYRAIWMIYPVAPRLPFWILNNILKISVAFLFAYALAKKSNKEFYDLMELSNELEKKVDEKTRELLLAKEKIEDNIQQRTNYFVNLAHETKTPLTLISNYLSRYVKKAGPDRETAVVLENFEKLKNDMIRLLDVEKFEKGLVSFDHEHPMNLSQRIESIKPLYSELARDRDLTIAFETDQDIFIHADPMAADSLLHNLLDNAIKYSKPDGTIKVRLQKVDNQAQLIVSDDGIGIEKEKIENIFEPYYQVSRPKQSGQGLGMGLYVVRNIVDSLGGKIFVHSEIGKGTEFVIELPLGAESSKLQNFPKSIKNPLSKQSTDRLEKPAFIPGRKNLLVVEDNKDMLLYLCEELTTDHNIFTACDGNEALLKLKTSPQIDLILSDVMMDKLDGYQFYDELSKNIQFRNIPFLFLTARSNDQEKIAMLTRGVTDYLYKPFSIDELKAKISSVLINTHQQRKAGLHEAVAAIQHQLEHPSDTARDKWLVFEKRKKEYELTSRQVEIIILIEQGLEHKEIADHLSLSVKTVHRHMQNVYEILGVHSKIELMKALFE